MVLRGMIRTQHFFPSEMRSCWRNMSKSMKWLHLLCHRMTLGAKSRAGYREDRIGRPFGDCAVSNPHEREGGLDQVVAAGVAREVTSWTSSMVRFKGICWQNVYRMWEKGESKLTAGSGAPASREGGAALSRDKVQESRLGGLKKMDRGAKSLCWIWDAFCRMLRNSRKLSSKTSLTWLLQTVWPW